MLNSKSQRELAYIVKVDDIQPIEGADRVEVAVVGGWHIMVKKEQFKIGDPAIYFEIDSKVPNTAPFEFLASKNYKVKTQKYFKGTVISQGLLMAATDFGWTIDGEDIIDDCGVRRSVNDESRFLTKKLNITYAEDSDNVRKNNISLRNKMLNCLETNKNPIVKYLYNKDWGKNLLLFFYQFNRDKAHEWPLWVKKTDEERIQNIPWILKNDTEWIATEKIDGTSATYTIKKGRFGKPKFYVCSRNVCFGDGKDGISKTAATYFEIAKRYCIREALGKILKDNPKCEWVTLQGEIYGGGIQKRDYSSPNNTDFAAFNLIFSDRGRLGTLEMSNILDLFKIPVVPILDIDIQFNESATVDTILNEATGISMIDDKMREGIVYRSVDGAQSFKAVSNSYLLKYHG